MTNKLLTMKKSAMSMTAKMNTLTQQCFRILHNTSHSIPLEEKAKHLNEFIM